MALVAAIESFRCIYAMPDRIRENMVSLLKAYGAEVVITATSVPRDSLESYRGDTESFAMARRGDRFSRRDSP